MMTLILLLLTIFFGFQLTGIFIRDGDFFEKISLGYLLGIGIFTFVWFLLNLAGIPYGLPSALVLLLSLNVFALMCYKLATRKWLGQLKPDSEYFKKLTGIEKTCIAAIIFLCVSALVMNLYWPVRYWDSLVLYDFRAKIFAQTGFMQEAIARGYFFGYPLLTSLAHTLVYIAGGSNPSFLYGLFYMAFVFAFFSNFKKMGLSRTWVLLLTLLAAVSPRFFSHTQWAYTNLPYSIYIVLGSVYLYFGVKKKNFGSYAVSAILIGISTWTRSAEPFWLTYLGLAVVLGLAIKKWFWPLFYSGIFISLMMPWRIFQAGMEKSSANVAAQVAATSSFALISLQFDIIKPALDFVIKNVVLVYLLYFILLVLTTLVKIFGKSRKWFFTLMIICNLALVFFGTLVFSRTQPYWQDIPDSLSRMVMFVPPMVIFLLAETFKEFSFFSESKDDAKHEEH